LSFAPWKVLALVRDEGVFEVNALQAADVR